MIREEDVINIGKFQRTHALKGELNMISDVDPEYFMEGNPLIIKYDGILVPFYIETVRPKGSVSYLVKLTGIDTEEEAAQFVNHEIYMLKKDASDWMDEDYVDSDSLIGYNIIDVATGDDLGVVEGIDDSTANILFLVRQKNGEELYLPASDDLITDIDEEYKLIRMTLPEGLLDINNKE